MEVLFRNGPCPCGSGRKFKRCHGEVSKAGSTPAKIAVPSAYQPFIPHGVPPWAAKTMHSASRQ